MFKLPLLGPSSVNAATCSACGGECCKTFPGIYAPEDVGAPDRERMASEIAQLLRAHQAAIDWWEGDPHDVGGESMPACNTAYYLRAPQRRHVGKVFHAAWLGGCGLLTERGCKLEHDARPYTCRAVKPARIPEVVCLPFDASGVIVEKRDQVLAWLPYADLLRQVGLEVDS